MNDFPYHEYPVFFPGSPANLVQLHDAATGLIHRINETDIDWNTIDRSLHEIDIPMHQVGGEPVMLDADSHYRMICPICDEAMPFLAQIGNYCLDPRGFTSNDYVQVLFNFCPKCNVIGTFHLTE